jgi:hypothetical protein
LNGVSERPKKKKNLQPIDDERIAPHQKKECLDGIVLLYEIVEVFETQVKHTIEELSQEMAHFRNDFRAVQEAVMNREPGIADFLN